MIGFPTLMPHIPCWAHVCRNDGGSCECGLAFHGSSQILVGSRPPKDVEPYGPLPICSRRMRPTKTSVARVFLPVKCSLQEIVLTRDCTCARVKGVKDRKVIWHECTLCGRDWPFPYPDAPCGGIRDWHCHVCINAELARYQRNSEPENVTHWLCPKGEHDAFGGQEAPAFKLTQTLNDEVGRQRRYVCTRCLAEITVNFRPL
jgi:hypothetical protein